VIHSYNLPPTLQTAEETGTYQTQSLKDAVDTFEKELIIDSLKSTRGNMRHAATSLHTTERIFGYKVKRYNIEPKLYR
jgi:Nif-specific regulatory protein